MNRLRNRGAKLGLYFVHEKILDLIELYIDIYKYECRDSCQHYTTDKSTLAKNCETKNRKFSEKDRQRNIASALEGRIRGRLENAESNYNFKLYDLRLKKALIPFLKEKLSHEQMHELINKLQNASDSDLLAKEKDESDLEKAKSDQTIDKENAANVRKRPACQEKLFKLLTIKRGRIDKPDFV